MPNSDQMHPAVKLLSSITYLESLDAVTLESVARTAVKRTYDSGVAKGQGMGKMRA